MQSTLRKPFAAAALLACAAAVLAQPAFARDPQWVVQAPAVVVPAPAAVAPAPAYGRDIDRDDHEGWRRGPRDGWWRDARRDDRGPNIVDLTPLPGERVGERYRMTVSARFRDYASGVDPASVRLRIDGRDVTGAARIDDDEVRFRDNLFPGRHFAEVIVRDRAGNATRRAWQFDVVDRERHAWRDDAGDGWRRGGWGWQR